MAGEDDTARDGVAWDVTVPVSAGARATGAGARERRVENDEAPVSVSALELERPLEVVGEIGAGGMGTVLRIADPHLGRHVAMKVLRPEVRIDSNEGRRFIEEAQVTGQLDHPNVVPVYSLSCDDDDRPYFTMKLVRGLTLAALVEEMGETRLEAKNLEELIGIVIKVCDAVSFAHSRRVIHRDLKPQNLMIGSHGQVYVMDWGIASVLGAARLATDENRTLGTPAYMAPEQALRRAVSEQTDVHGIGGLIYGVLTGEPPHAGASVAECMARIATTPVQPPAERVPHLSLPPELCRIAMRALAIEPAERHATVAELRAELVEFQHGGGWLATRHFAAGEFVFREGDAAEEAYILTAGECEVFTTSAGEREVVRRVAVGAVLGELALLHGGTRAATAVAVGPVTVKVVTRASLERELQRSGWMKALFFGVAERFRILERHLHDTGPLERE